jgi:hypothetical protein
MTAAVFVPGGAAVAIAYRGYRLARVASAARRGPVDDFIMYAKKKRLPAKNKGRAGHENGGRPSTSDKHSKAEGHGGARRIPPNRNKRNPGMAFAW